MCISNSKIALCRQVYICFQNLQNYYCNSKKNIWKLLFKSYHYFEEDSSKMLKDKFPLNV
jgi:hypothetical protein